MIRYILILLLFYCTEASMLHAQKIIIWDNDGTIMGSRDPHDTSGTARIILPNVAQTMHQEKSFNIICSGMKTIESESTNYDPEIQITKFKKLMLELPVSIAVFSPAIGGTECWIIMKDEQNNFVVLQAHKDERYYHLIGTFKKPDTGMLIVIKDLLQEKNITYHDENTIFIGDAWQDMHAAHGVQLPFLHAHHIHYQQINQECWNFAIHWRHKENRS